MMASEIPKAKSLSAAVFSVSNDEAFDKIALELYQFQFLANPVYGAFCRAINRTPQNVLTAQQIPFLPIRFFKTHAIKSGEFEPEAVFKSSGTGGENSYHHVKETALYQKSFLKGFEKFYGNPSQYCILGLLPSYLEQGQSSLVYMVDALIKESGHPQSNFYLHNHQELAQTLQKLEAESQPAIVFGVSYALLQFAASFPTALKHTTIIETGGMKGRGPEISKEALYAQLRDAFSLKEIHSEYGMTELLSQAYAINGRYFSPPWMKIWVRDETDPFAPAKKNGAINIIDLANIYSCSFIATDDLGRLHGDGSFEVLGRMDGADVRGCSQLVY